jgi:hypothetical protein
MYKKIIITKFILISLSYMTINHIIIYEDKVIV